MIITAFLLSGVYCSPARKPASDTPSIENQEQADSVSDQSSAKLDPTDPPIDNEWNDDTNSPPETPSQWALDQFYNVMSFGEGDDDDDDSEGSGEDPEYDRSTGVPEGTIPESEIGKSYVRPVITSSSAPSYQNSASKSLGKVTQETSLHSFLKLCFEGTMSLNIRQEFCQGTLDFIAESLLEPHSDRLNTEVVGPYNVGTCEFSPELTLKNGQVVGADSIEGEEMSFISVSAPKKSGETHNAIDDNRVPFRTILVSATSLCDENILLTSNIKHRTLLKLEKNSFDITNVIKFSKFFKLLGPKTKGPSEAPQNPTNRPTHGTGQ